MPSEKKHARHHDMTKQDAVFRANLTESSSDYIVWNSLTCTCSRVQLEPGQFCHTLVCYDTGECLYIAQAVQGDRPEA
jgi:hypothetical protein